MKRVGGHEVDSAPEELLETVLHMHEMEEPDGVVKLDEKVYVAVWASFTAGD